MMLSLTVISGTCFTDHIEDKMTFCSSKKESHWFCLHCARAQANTLVGQSKWDLRCMSTEGCSSVFARPEVERFVDPPTLKKLDSLHFISGTRNIPGLEGMEECPFCDFKALMDPLTSKEDTFWFPCMSKSCGKYSCRKCKEVWHPGKKCGHDMKDQKLDVRHLVEEAMTSAMVQSCK